MYMLRGQYSLFVKKFNYHYLLLFLVHVLTFQIMLIFYFLTVHTKPVVNPLFSNLETSDKLYFATQFKF